ncbi:MAG: LysR substrate-binding domain-containing protein, partial [Pseudomonadota bacterium]
NILHDVAETRTALRELAEQPGGEVAIGLPTTVAAGVGPLVLKRVRSRHPRIRLHLVEAMSGALVELLQLGRIDMAILFDIQPMAGLRSEPLLIEDLRLVVASTSPLARRKAINFSDIAAIDLVMPSRSNSIRRLVETTAQAEGMTLRVEADVDSLGCMISLVESGFAAILPTFMVMPAINAGNVHDIEVKRPSLAWTLHLATRRDSVRPQAAMAVADLTVEVASELVRTGVWPARLHPRISR